MASQVTINNPLMASFDFSLAQNSIITLSNFVLITNIPSQFSAVITITNISSQSSVKPVTGNRISFYRNGYLYDQSHFTFSVSSSSMKSVSLSLASNSANAKTNLTISITFLNGVVANDYLYGSIDQAIAVTACSVISCSNCSCVITVANPTLGNFNNKIKITGFDINNSSSTALVQSVVISLGIRNPISSDYILYFTTTDQYNYTK